MQNVINTFEAARLLHSDKTVRLFDYTNRRVIASGRRTKATGIDLGMIITDGAKDDSLFDLAKRRNESLNIGFSHAHDMKGEPLGGLLTNTRQTFEFVN